MIIIIFLIVNISKPSAVEAVVQAGGSFWTWPRWRRLCRHFRKTLLYWRQKQQSTMQANTIPPIWPGCSPPFSFISLPERREIFVTAKLVTKCVRYVLKNRKSGPIDLNQRVFVSLYQYYIILPTTDSLILFFHSFRPRLNYVNIYIDCIKGIKQHCTCF